MTLNAKLGRNGGSECPTKLVARNVMLRKTTLNIINEKTRWLRTLNWKGIMTLNTKTGEMALNAERGSTTALNTKTGEMALNAKRG